MLRLGSGLADAQFRDGQEEAIQHVVQDASRLLIVQRTGWGKSFVYFIATKLLREAGYGPALIISPLLSLMRNQIAAAERMGLQALTIHSENQSEHKSIEDKVRRGKFDILLITPERLADNRFCQDVLARVAGNISFFVVDEAHCLSDWGHDFRPEYRLVARILREAPRLRVLAATATANNRVLADLESMLGSDLQVLRGDLGRPSLMLQTIVLRSQAERLAWLAGNLDALPGSGIVYTLTVRDAEQVALWLQSRGLNVEAYTSRSGGRRTELEHALLENRVKALVATTALGMGFDKPDLGFVVHYQAPGSVIHYYQQVGRAGRALDAAYGILLGGDEDSDILDHFIRSAFPSRSEVEMVLGALAAADEGRSIPELEAVVNLPRERIEKTVELLAIEEPAPIVMVGKRWRRTATDLSEAFWERVDRLTEIRKREQAEMQEYLRLDSGHMEFLVRALDGDVSAVTTCALPPLPTNVDPVLVQEAVMFLRRTDLPIEPRKQWPQGGLPRYRLRGEYRPISGIRVGGPSVCGVTPGGEASSGMASTGMGASRMNL